MQRKGIHEGFVPVGDATRHPLGVRRHPGNNSFIRLDAVCGED